MAPRDYGRIFEDLKAKYGGQVDEHELRRIHRKWRQASVNAAKPGGKYIA